MKKELSESIKSELIQILNQNIKLEEAYYSDKSLKIGKMDSNKKDEEESTDGSQAGGDSTPQKEKPKFSFSDIVLGTEPLKAPGNIDIGVPEALGMAAGGKIVGGVGRIIGGKLAQGMTNLFGGGKVSKMIGGGLGDLFGKATADIETLSGAPSMQAQIADIAPHQLALRWEGSGTPGWFRPLIPKSELEPTKPKTSQEIEQEKQKARRDARIKRIKDIELANKEKKYKLPPI